MHIRSVTDADINPLAQLWYDGWQDAHRDILPAALAQHRTLESFRLRLGERRGDLLVAGEEGAPLGFVLLKDDELYQMYVATAARGTGLATSLIEAAENQLRMNGFNVVWLACAIGNARAARFYEKCGWTQTGVVTSLLEVPGGIFSLEVWRFEKRLSS